METPRNETDTFEREYKVMGVFIDNAKTYVQLSAGALLLSVTFLHEILGISKEQRLPTDLWLMLSWWSFLAAIVLGALYQYYAAKFLEWKSGVPRSHRNWPEWLVRHPWPVYGGMLIAFYLGGLCFTIAAVRRL
ncbi:MAG TPA: hypothetical protein VMT20_18745 [Terriglobia bacterium]|nr:hypothetical protein [Terriglobia bacterium]